MIAINYSPTSIEDFRSAVDLLVRHGLTSGHPVKVSSPVAGSAERSAASSTVRDEHPTVTRWKELAGASRFRLTSEERESGLPDYEIAQMRIDAMGLEVDDLDSIPAPDEPEITDEDREHIF